MSEILTRAGVEDRIMHLCATLEEATYSYERASQAAAEAEAEYRKHKAHATLAMVNNSKGMTAAERDARADLMVSEEHRTYLITKATRDSTREHLASIRGTLDALRTLSASVRAQT